MTKGHNSLGASGLHSVSLGASGLHGFREKMK